MISDGAAEAIKEDNAMSVFFMDFDMAPSVIWARDLYDQMQIQSDFRKWFPRMCQYGFVEGRDYEFVPRVRPQDEGGRTVQRYVKDYRITLEMAKQLYKLHHFHKNDCFRSCEGQHCMGTDHWMQAVIELLHQHKCKSHAPPKRFYELRTWKSKRKPFG
jgi:anti-repressor protein